MHSVWYITEQILSVVTVQNKVTRKVFDPMVMWTGGWRKLYSKAIAKPFPEKAWQWLQQIAETYSHILQMYGTWLYCHSLITYICWIINTAVYLVFNWINTAVHTTPMLPHCSPSWASSKTMFWKLTLLARSKSSAMVE